MGNCEGTLNLQGLESPFACIRTTSRVSEGLGHAPLTQDLIALQRPLSSIRYFIFDNAIAIDVDMSTSINN
jgi:hypothetical protein